MVLLVMMLDVVKNNNNKNIGICYTLKKHITYNIYIYIKYIFDFVTAAVEHDDKTYYEKFFKHALITMVLDAFDEEPCTQKT